MNNMQLFAHEYTDTQKLINKQLNLYQRNLNTKGNNVCLEINCTSMKIFKRKYFSKTAGLLLEEVYDNE